jgi:hypothetical protein
MLDMDKTRIVLRRLLEITSSTSIGSTEGNFLGFVRPPKRRKDRKEVDRSGETDAGASGEDEGEEEEKEER